MSTELVGLIGMGVLFVLLGPREAAFSQRAPDALSLSSKASWWSCRCSS